MHADLDLGLTQAIIKECRKQGLLRNQTAYVLATAYWESGRTMQPVEEAYYLAFGKRPVKNLDAWRRKHLRYYPWYGRGLVQLTWEYNYFKASKKTGVDLIAHPEKALDPEVAVKVLVTGMKEGWFTGKKLSDYVTLQHSHFFEARRIINGKDEADTISEIALSYDSALHVLNWE